MKHITIGLLGLLFVTFLSAFGQEQLDLEIIYPRNNMTVNAPSTFFTGNTNPEAKLTINGKEIQVFPNGGFTQVVDLKRGINTFNLKSTYKNMEKNLVYTIKVPEFETTIPKSPLKIDLSSISPRKNITYQPGDIIQVKFKGSTGNTATFSIGSKENIPMTELPAMHTKTKPSFGKEFKTSKMPVKGIYSGAYTIQESDNFKDAPISVKLSSKDKSIKRITSVRVSTIPKDAVPTIAEVIRDNAVVRVSPEESRLTPLTKGIRLYITGRVGNDYRFKMGDTMSGFISAGDVKILPKGTPIPESKITSIKIEPDDGYTKIQIPLSQKLPVSIDQVPGPQMVLNIYGGSANLDLIPYNPNNTFIKEIKWIQASTNTFRLIIVPDSSQFWGYTYGYEDNNLVLKLKNPPYVDKNCALKDKIITIDPGHGGNEPGAIGPTGIPEKTINLGIAKYLKEELEKSGAKVIITRETDDENPDLYERSEIANKNNSQILLSIHNNSLPDGRNPYKEHGSSTYYYHSQSLPLARTLQNSLIQNLGLKNYGIFWDNLALTRPNEPLAVLVEVGFMIHPEEYMLLTDHNFQKKAANALYLGLENFFKQYASN